MTIGYLVFQLISMRCNQMSYFIRPTDQNPRETSIPHIYEAEYKEWLTFFAWKMTKTNNQLFKSSLIVFQKTNQLINWHCSSIWKHDVKWFTGIIQSVSI